MKNTNMNLKDSFDEVYKKRLWTDNNKYTLSGPGSEIEYAKICITFLKTFIKNHSIRKIVDGSCGDCLWIMEILKEFPDIEYIGYDISQTIVDINKQKYKKYEFYQKNILDIDNLPQCDLFIFRHTMMHLSIDDNIKIINMLKNNTTCYVMLTHHEVHTNLQGESHFPKGASLKWMPKNLHIKPFQIQKYLIEYCKENSPQNEFGCVYKFN